MTNLTHTRLSHRLLVRDGSQCRPSSPTGTRQPPMFSAGIRTLSPSPKAGGHARIYTHRVATNLHDQVKNQ